MFVNSKIKWKVFLAFALLAMGKGYSDYKVLPVNILGQIYSNWCWAASDQMVRNFYSEATSQCDAANSSLGRSDCCWNSSCNVPGTPRVIKPSFRYAYTPIASMNYSAIRGEINSGRPVLYLVNYLPIPNGGNHFRVIVGYDDVGEKILIHDPLPVGAGTKTWITMASYLGGSAYGYVAGTNFQIVKLPAEG